MFEQSQLVVDSHHLSFVQHWLQDPDEGPGVTAGHVEVDESLELALLSDFTGAPARGEHLRAHIGDESPSRLKYEPAPQADIDALLVGIRRYASAKYHGWTPIVGKNITVDTFDPEGGSKHPMTILGGSKHPMSLLPLEVIDTGMPLVPRRAAEDMGAGVRVAVVDTPVYPHPRVVDHVVDPTDLADLALMPAEEWQPWMSHGTFVADLIIQQAPGATLLVEPITDPAGQVTSWALAKKLGCLVGKGADIVNLSLGRALDDDGEPPLGIVRALEQLSRTAVIVVAGGNVSETDLAWERNRPFSPASLPNVVAVGTHGDTFSPRVPWLDFIAPGEKVAAAYVDPHHRKNGGPDPFTSAKWSGTSFAAATFSGRLAALSTPGTARQELLELQAKGDPVGVVERFVWGR